MTKRIPLLLTAAVALAAPALAAQPHAKLTMAQARAIELKQAPGKIQDAEYEKEGGGWRYSFDIRQGKRIHEIGVDANTGRVVENKYEGLNDKD
ncbi:PepSY domain-containing protein [Sphingomonas oligophenolica]|nr:PepSY domain-containing protein [Sphingomonas oligophenolica]